MKLPEGFRTRVRNVWGSGGDKWLEAFPDILSGCMKRWKLISITMHPELSYNFIAHGESETLGKVVLKIGVPVNEMEDEISALKLLNGDHTVRLLDSDSIKGALLLEEITPAKPLHALDDNVQESLIAARLIDNIPIPAQRRSTLPTVEKWSDVFDRIISGYESRSRGLPVKTVEKAKGMARGLAETSNGKWLLHGDLHHGNILFDKKRGWLAIDPKGVIGDRAYECARFLHNPMPDFLSCEDPITKTEERVDVFSEYLNEDRNRILGWAFVDCIIGACWDIEESIDNVDYYVQVARLLEGLIQ
ncbi:hypothetical protein GF359_00170 [candidate division WOR-3 bacterium]|uniref:Aminoglycoside resistance protein n=1 Tax=candidate division WOR-3 bacterium TaxID=2052148 RepID=A0A9D5K7N0_UNCW3|nr:hypothetical protein [candidate division WOR-3 bacterium]MBD3363609.1 hypothetical protein [candidate division WOR-3 bacterium]